MLLYSRSQQRVKKNKPCIHSWDNLSCELARPQGRLWKICFITCELSNPHGWEFTVNGEGPSDESVQDRQSPDANAPLQRLTFPHPCHALSPHHSRRCRGRLRNVFLLSDGLSKYGRLPRLNFAPCWSGWGWGACPTPGLCHLLKKATSHDCKATLH